MKTSKISNKQIAELINEGCQLSTEKKEIESRLSEIKALLKEDLEDDGKYTTKENGILEISSRKEYTDINPVKARKALKEKGLAGFYPEVIKVALDPLRKYLSDMEIEELRQIKGVTRIMKFI